MLQVGDMAPDFELASHLEKDKKVKLSDLRGKNVVIAFYPLDWTPV
jgi:peroxiredoxin